MATFSVLPSVPASWITGRMLEEFPVQEKSWNCIKNPAKIQRTLKAQSVSIQGLLHSVSGVRPNCFKISHLEFGINHFKMK